MCRLLFVSFVFQFFLTVATLFFCFAQLYGSVKHDEKENIIYYNLIASCLAYWFPSPITNLEKIEDERKTKATKTKANQYAADSPSKGRARSSK